MHENREISSVPWSDDQGRSAKAMNRTAGMQALEKSDCAVIPVTQPNKGGQLSAEAVEGRAQTKENIVQSHMHPTQSGKRMSQGLGGVRRAARERKQERFTALLHHLSVDLLRDSFHALQRKASPGVDGVTWQGYETGLEGRLIDLHSRVHPCASCRSRQMTAHLQALHRVRDRLMARRTSLINQIRAFLLERGIVFAKRAIRLREVLPEVLENAAFDRWQGEAVWNQQARQLLKASKPSTFVRCLERWYAVALPIAPRPTTITSNAPSIAALHSMQQTASRETLGYRSVEGAPVVADC